MENQYIIKGGTPLNGEVTIGGAKNAALGILAAAIMADETVVIDNLPNVRDINVLLTAIESIGATVKRIGSPSARSVHLIICLAHCLANTRRHRLLCRVAVRSEAVRSTFI